MWVVPGAPLEGGGGWRIWYSQEGHADFQPKPVTVTLGGQAQPTDQSWSPLPDLPELARRMGVLTVTLPVTRPGEVYEVSVPEAGLAEPFRWRSMPAVIGPEGVTFLLASCFWHGSDREGAYAAALRFLTNEMALEWMPAFKLLVGDQIYGDWPPEQAENFGPVEYYAARYEEYWGDALYREALQSTPTFFLCDDHEFWNDYPERQIHLPRTWSKAQRKIHGAAAFDLYRRFQQCLDPGTDPWYQFSIGDTSLNVSLFLADTRSQRDPFGTPAGAHFIQPPQWRALEQWVDGLTGPGVLILGQPLFQKDGDWKDHSLSNFADDYGRLWALIEKSLTGQNVQRKRHDILVLSGDIHTGRFATSRSADLGEQYGVPELIASAASMIRPGSKEVEEPDYRFTVRFQGQSRVWKVDQDPDRAIPFMTLNSNVARVRMVPGTNGRVRFEMSLWQTRPYDPRSWWDRLTGEAPPAGAVVQLNKTPIEVELQ